MDDHIATEVRFIRYSKTMECVRAGTNALLARIEGDGLLRLTMADIRSYDSFKELLLSLHGCAKFAITWEDGETEYFKLADGSLESVEVDW